MQLVGLFAEISHERAHEPLGEDHRNLDAQSEARVGTVKKGAYGVGIELGEHLLEQQEAEVLARIAGRGRKQVFCANARLETFLSSDAPSTTSRQKRPTKLVCCCVSLPLTSRSITDGQTECSCAHRLRKRQKQGHTFGIVYDEEASTCASAGRFASRRGPWCQPLSGNSSAKLN